MRPSAIADGYLAGASMYDGYLYWFGKGKSATTVEGPKTAIALGQSVVITGTVLDESPAQSGTPCVSKESMTTQMEYLHMQLPIDGIWQNVTMTGVPVTLTAIGSDGAKLRGIHHHSGWSGRATNSDSRAGNPSGLHDDTPRRIHSGHYCGRHSWNTRSKEEVVMAESTKNQPPPFLGQQLFNVSNGAEKASGAKILLL